MTALAGTRAPSPPRPRRDAEPPDETADRAGAPEREARLRRPAVLLAFSLAAVGAGTARALTTTYLPVLLARIQDAPSLIGAVMTVNALAGLAVPPAVGVWSDRRAADGLGRRLPFMVGGTVVAAGGLVAIGLGNSSSYLALALAATVVYIGLNALTTAHRTLVADDVADERRPAASSGQEFAMTLGAGAAVGLGAALIEPAPGAAFALAAAVLVFSALPTLLVTRRLGLGTGARPRPQRPARESLRGALRRPGAREVLLAQTLWVFAYAALPAFFVLYAEEALALEVGIAGALPLAFGLFAALGIAYGGRVEPARVHRMLLTGAVLLGAGLLVGAVMSTLAHAAVPLAVAALGAGLLTALGFPYYARFVPAGEAGGYSGVFFAARGVAAAAALPIAGLAVEVTGTYRSVLLLGAGALAALVPLVVAGSRGARPVALRRAPASVAAVIPVFASARAAQVARATLPHVDELVLVDDGAPPEIARSLAPLAADDRVHLLTLARNGGKGTAVAAGVQFLLSGASRPEAVVVLDSDGQHDPDRIPAFVEAARAADVVIGRRRTRAAMPARRRVANRAASVALLAAARRWVPDTQNGMRLFRTESVLDVPPPNGGYEAESRHLRALLAGRRRVASVDVPTIYEGEPSHFRPVHDTLAVGRALLAAPHRAPAPRGGAGTVLHEWVPRLTAALLTALAIAVALPALQPLDSRLFLAINGLGDGPDWLYRALDPHARNYVLLFVLTVVTTAIVSRRPRHVLGAALAVVLAGYLAGAAIEIVKLLVDRARPEELLGAQVQLSHGRSWAHLESFPSGHLVVTVAIATAAAAAAPVLRRPLIVYVAAVALTRVLFGAHFPLDVVAGAILGHEVGLFAAFLLANARLLPAPAPHRAPASRPREECAEAAGASSP